MHGCARSAAIEAYKTMGFSGTCALFQFNMWQNGNVGIEELQGRLKMFEFYKNQRRNVLLSCCRCVQQAICDLVTEFGLLSNSLFESYSTSIRSKAGTYVD